MQSKSRDGVPRGKALGRSGFSHLRMLVAERALLKRVRGVPTFVVLFDTVKGAKAWHFRCKDRLTYISRNNYLAECVCFKTQKHSRSRAV